MFLDVPPYVKFTLNILHMEEHFILATSHSVLVPNQERRTKQGRLQSLCEPVCESLYLWTGCKSLCEPDCIMVLKGV